MLEKDVFEIAGHENPLAQVPGAYELIETLLSLTSMKKMPRKLQKSFCSIRISKQYSRHKCCLWRIQDA